MFNSSKKNKLKYIMYQVIELFKYTWNHKSNRNKKLYSITKMLLWQFYKRIINKPIYYHYNKFIKIKCYPNNVSTNAVIYTSGFFDYNEMNFLKNYLRKGDTFLDIGANCGVYSLIAASVIGKDAHIDAFEPNPDVISFLEENIKINNLKNVNIHRKAVSSKKHNSTFFKGIDPSSSHLAKTTNKENILVECVDLDSELVDKYYTLAKIDIEGGEIDALLGAKNMLKHNNPPVWIIEINSSQLKYFGYTVKDLFDILKFNNYIIAKYDADKKKLIIINELDQNCDWQNILAITNDKIDFVNSRIVNNN
jgi:FkbM family methyltransferase